MSNRYPLEPPRFCVQCSKLLLRTQSKLCSPKCHGLYQRRKPVETLETSQPQTWPEGVSFKEYNIDCEGPMLGHIGLPPDKQVSYVGCSAGYTADRGEDEHKNVEWDVRRSVSKAPRKNTRARWYATD